VPGSGSTEIAQRCYAKRTAAGATQSTVNVVFARYVCLCGFVFEYLNPKSTTLNPKRLISQVQVLVCCCVCVRVCERCKAVKVCCFTCVRVFTMHVCVCVFVICEWCAAHTAGVEY